MNRIGKIMFLMVLIGIVGTAQAQRIYSCDFEDNEDRSEWIVMERNDVNKWCIGSATATSAGGKSMYVSNDGGRSFRYSNSGLEGNYSYAVISHPFTIDEDGTYVVRYDWKSVGKIFFDFMRVAIVPSDIQLLEDANDDLNNSLPDGWIAVDGGSYLSDHPDWTTYSADIDLESGNYNLVYVFYADRFITSVPAAIDNVVIAKDNCPKLTDMYMFNYRENGFTIGWNRTEEVDSWNVEYGLSGFKRGSSEGTLVRNIDTSRYDITGLEAGSIYDVYVGCNCGEDTSFVKKIQAHTTCTYAELPYREDFDAYECGYFLNCWTCRKGSMKIVDDDSGNKLEVSAGSCLISPKFYVPSVGLGFMFNTYSIASIKVGYITDLESWDYHYLSTVTSGSEFNNQYIELNSSLSEMPDSCYFVIEVNDDIYIDNVKVESLSNIHAPQHLVFDNITTHSADLSWECDVNADFEVWYGEEPDQQYGDYVKLIKKVHRATTTTLNNISGECNIHIRSIYQGDTSDWIYGGGFSTEKKVQRVRDLYTEVVSNSVVDLYWKAPAYGEVDKYYVECGEGQSMSYMQRQTITNGNTNCRLTNLHPTNDYNVNVYAISGSDTSEKCTIRFKSDSLPSTQSEGYKNYLSWRFPFSDLYTLTTSIYPATLVADIDSITGFAFKTTTTATRKIKLYVGFTDKFKYTKIDDFIPLSDLTLVYDGNYEMTGGWDAHWDTIMFTTPIAIDRSKNVVIGLYDSTGSNCRNTNYGSLGSSMYLGKYDMIHSEDLQYMDIEEMSPDAIFVGPSRTTTYKHPKLLNKTPHANSLTYEWSNLGAASSWTVDYRQLGDDEWIESVAQTTSQTHTITNLIPGNQYEVRIGALTGSDTLFIYSVDYTLRGVANVPYIEKFDYSYMNESWILSQYASHYDACYHNDNMLNFSNNSYAILPKFNVPINQLQISIASSFIGGDIAVGAIQENESMSNFIPIDTIRCSTTMPVTALDNYTGADGYIVLWAIRDETKIDSICVERIPDCPIPQKVKIIDYGKDYVKVTWEDNPNVTSWVVTIVEGENPIDSEGAVTINSTTNEAVLNELNASTLYSIYVSSDCGSERNVANPVSCITLSENPFEIPFTCNFMDEEQNSKWKFITNSEGSMSHWMIGSLGENDTVMYITDSTNSENSYDASAKAVCFAYVPIKVDEDGLYGISYDWQCMGSEYDYGMVKIMPANTDFSTITIEDVTGYWPPVGWINLNGESRLSLNQWTTNNIEFYIDAGFYYLVFGWINLNHTQINPAIAFDNIHINKIECDSPRDVHVIDITESSAFIYWNYTNSNVCGWELQFNDEAPIFVTEPYYYANNLNSSKSYNLTIKTKCSSENQSMICKTQFCTNCGDIQYLPYINDFESEQSGQFPVCWNNNSGFGYANFGLLSYYMDRYSYPEFTLPRVSENLDITQSKVVFDASADEDMVIEVGVSYESNGSSFELVNSVIVGQNKTHYSIPLVDYTENGRYVEFKVSRRNNYTAESYVKLDNVGIDTLTVSDQPIHARVDMVTWQSIVLGWNLNSGQSKWMAVILNEDGSYRDTLRVTEPTATFNNLKSGTKYTMSVFAICDDDELGVSSQLMTATTYCGVASNLTATDITPTSARISWTVSPDQERWEVFYGPKGFYSEDVTSGKVVEVEEPMIVLTDLIPETVYDVHVKSICDENNTAISLPVTFKATENGVGVDGVAGDYQFMIYPNPTSGATTISLSGVEGELNISVVDINGRMIMNETMSCGSDCEKRLDVDGLAQGTYFVRVLGDEINSVRKLIVR